MARYGWHILDFAKSGRPSFVFSILFGEILLILARAVETNHDIHLPKPKWREHSLASYLDLAFYIPFTGRCHLAYSVVAAVVYFLLFSFSTVSFGVAAAAICLSLAIPTEITAVACLLLTRLRNRTPWIALLYLVSSVAWECLRNIITQASPQALLKYWDQRRPILDEYLRQVRNHPPKPTLADVLLPWTDMSLGLQPETATYLLLIVYEVWAAFCMSTLLPKMFFLGPLRKLFRIGSPEEACAVVACLSTFLFSLLWYAFMFQSHGTHDPPWTEIFWGK